MGLGSQLKHAWDAFNNREDIYTQNRTDFGVSSAFRPDRLRTYANSEKSFLTSILTRISVDVAATAVRHVRLDDAGRYLEDIDSGLNNCFTVEANLDQAATAFMQDVAWTLLNKGVATVVPVVTTLNPRLSGSYDILTMRCGTVEEWMPQRIKTNLYNENTGNRESLTLLKRNVAIVENPLYAVMNEPNGTLQRLVRKLSLLDIVDEASSSGKLDLIIQLPYVVKTEAKREAAEQRAKDIEFQLRTNKYGIAYIDGTEKVTQLNRPAENSLMSQIEYLTAMLYGQLGITEEIMNGTADEKAMLNYHNRTIEPILKSITEAMVRSFITKTARTQRQSIMYFRDPFKLVPIASIADIADKFARNEILSSNELRAVIGFKPSRDPKAEELRNSNMPPPPPETPTPAAPPSVQEGNKPNDNLQNGS